MNIVLCVYKTRCPNYSCSLEKENGREITVMNCHLGNALVRTMGAKPFYHNYSVFNQLNSSIILKAVIRLRIKRGLNSVFGNTLKLRIHMLNKRTLAIRKY